jgi:hypothetical protein
VLSHWARKFHIDGHPLAVHGDDHKCPWQLDPHAVADLRDSLRGVTHGLPFLRFLAFAVRTFAAALDAFVAISFRRLAG